MIDVSTFLICVGVYFGLGIALGTQWRYEDGFRDGWETCDKFWAEEALKGALEGLKDE